MKKTLSLLLALVMVIGTFPSFADANVGDNVAEKALEVLKGYDGVVKGSVDANGNVDYMIDQKLKRQDAAIFLCRLLGEVKDYEALNVTEKPFPDVENAFYNNVIQYVKDKGYFKGRTDGNFGYDDSITVQEFAMIVLRALGYDDVEFDKAVDKAKELGLLKDVADMKNTDDIKRADVYIIMNNTLNTNKKDGTQALKYELGFVKTDFEVKVVGQDKLELKFGQEVDLKKEDIMIKKGNFDQKIHSITTNKEKTVVTVKTAKLQAGDYEVTVALSEDNKLNSSFVVEGKKQLEIKILGEKALTGKGKDDEGKEMTAKFAYVYYDVIDQYGNSVRDTTSIQWTGSADKVKDEKNIGRLTFKRSDKKAFTYGEQLYVTGVHVKDGATVNKALTIGQEQSANTIDILGFVKKGTTSRLLTLPKGFLSDTYYLIYDMNDQQGNYLEPEMDPVDKGQLTFVIKDGIMVIEKLDKDDESIQVIDGVAHNGIMVKPGLKVDEGGPVTISAIANKTGANTEWETSVDDVAILNSFVISSPALIADGDQKVEIPFTATDKDGNEIKDFETIAKNEIFNQLSLSCSDGDLILMQEDDGSAKLYYYDKNVTWKDSSATDNVDRNVSMTAVVVGGEASNELLYIQDKRRPEKIVYNKDGYVDRYFVEAGKQELELKDFDYLDQYGENMADLEDDDVIGSYDNGFFSASDIPGDDFKDYTFGVSAEFNGMTDFFKYSDYNNASKTAVADDTVGYIKDGSKLTIYAIEPDADGNTDTKYDDASVEFQIFKEKEGTYSKLGRKVVDKTAVLDMSMVDNVTFDDAPKKIRIQTANSDKDNGDNLTTDELDGRVKPAGSGNDIFKENDPDKNVWMKEFKLKGRYNNRDVDIPDDYYIITSKILQDSNVSVTPTGSSTYAQFRGKAGDKIFDAFLVDGALDDELLYKDIYNVNSAKNVRQDYTFDVEATVYQFDADGKIVKEKGEVKKSVEKVSVKVSDDKPYADDILLAKEWTSCPKLTEINYEYKYGKMVNPLDDGDVITDLADLEDEQFTVLDQYGVAYDSDDDKEIGSFEISNFKPAEDEFAANNFNKTNSGDGKLNIEGAERGDSFDLKIIIGEVSKTVKVNVGADEAAQLGVYNGIKYSKLDDGFKNKYIADYDAVKSLDKNSTSYLDGLRNILDDQRKAGL